MSNSSLSNKEVEHQVQGKIHIQQNSNQNLKYW